MTRLQEKYNKIIILALKQRFHYRNDQQAPRVEKVVVSVGTGPGLRDPRFNDVVEDTLKRITGQKPIRTTAKKSISNFKIRQGMVVGQVVTLRGPRMYDFLDKLINVTLPRVRDFRGLNPKALDQQGNLNISFKEHMAFPEIRADEVEKIHGLQITVTTTAKTRDESIELLKQLGFPFAQS